MGLPSPVKGVVRAAVEATVNVAVKTVALIAVKAVVNAVVVGVVGVSPTQKQTDRTRTTDPLLNSITR